MGIITNWKRGERVYSLTNWAERLLPTKCTREQNDDIPSEKAWNGWTPNLWVQNVKRLPWEVKAIARANQVISNAKQKPPKKEYSKF